MLETFDCNFNKKKKRCILAVFLKVILNVLRDVINHNLIKKDVSAFLSNYR